MRPTNCRGSRRSASGAGVPLQEFGAGLTEFTGKLRRFRERVAEEYWHLRALGPEGEKIAESIATSVSNEQAFERALAGIRSIRSASGQRTLARLLFGTDNFAELGRRFSPEIMAEIAKNLGDIPKGALGAAEAWNTAFDNLKEAAVGARNSLAMESGLLGTLTDLINGFREFAMNKDPETGFTNIKKWADEARSAPLKNSGTHVERRRFPGRRQERAEAHRGQPQRAAARASTRACGSGRSGGRLRTRKAASPTIPATA